MSDDFPRPPGGAHLRAVALPRDANASGDIFGGWIVSQMDLAGGTFAAAHSGKRVVTARINNVTFLKPVLIGDDVSVFCALEREGDTSITVAIEVWARDRTGDAPRKVTEGMLAQLCRGGRERRTHCCEVMAAGPLSLSRSLRWARPTPAHHPEGAGRGVKVPPSRAIGVAHAYDEALRAVEGHARHLTTLRRRQRARR